MNKNIPQLATIKVVSNGNIATGLLYFPGASVEYVYVLTAKHCLMGKDFKQPYSYKKIKLEQIFNPLTKTYHDCALTEMDQIVVSSDAEDLAIIILPKARILSLTEHEFFYQVVDTDPAIIDFSVRGFANLNGQEADRVFPMKFIEDQKDNESIFHLKSSENLDSFYQTALDNVEGLSGAGAFALLDDFVYLTGIVHTYEDGNVFMASKVLSYNQLIDISRYKPIAVVKPELNPAVIESFKQIDSNHKILSERTRNTVGTLNIPRETSGVFQMLENSSMALIYGKPGVGKSALAKAVTDKMMENSNITVVTVSAEQMYGHSFEEAFANAGYSAKLKEIITSPMSGNKIVIWIESFEKLIESGQDGAFRELLSILRTNKYVQLLVTIREYTLQKFKINYRFEVPDSNIYFELKDFTESEMEIVSTEVPKLNVLLSNTKLQHLLRTPYYLDKALRILPELLQEAHLDEVGFKRLMWEHIVEAGNVERGKSFLAICLKRASEMSLFTSSHEPTEMVGDLVRDNILQRESGDFGERFSPSHDILEDWALIRYIKAKMVTAESPKNFLESLESSPAFARAFRLWLDEFYKNEPDSSASFVHTVISNNELEKKWKDILLIATLRSEHPEILLDSMKDYLLAEGGHNLDNIFDLLRTGCQVLDYKNLDLNHFLPQGAGWDYILAFVRKNLSIVLGFRSFEFKYLSIIEIWSNQLPLFNIQELPKSSGDVAFLLVDFIHRHQDLLVERRRYQQNQSFLKKYLEILFKLTSVAQDNIKSLVVSAHNITEENTQWTNVGMLSNVRSYICDGVLADQICKYFPDEVFAIASEEWIEKQKTRRPGGLMSMIKEEPKSDYFGLDDQIKYEFGFPSGYQSFFYWMFLYHPGKAINFLINFLNTAFEKNQLARSKSGGEIKSIEIPFADGTVGSYYGCYEYWVMYRGTNSRNKLVTSLLMALEKGILDFAGTDTNNFRLVREYISEIILKTNNVATLAVVSSIFQAYPQILDEKSARLLGIKDFYIWDASRCSNEMFSHLDTYEENLFQKQEREFENKRKHRTKYYQGLVGFVSHYMFYYQTQNSILFDLVDKMWREKAKGDDVWRKYLFDMDARKYTFEPVKVQGYENFVQLVPGYDNKVKEMMSTAMDDHQVPLINTVWASNVFDYKEKHKNTYENWQIGYDYIRRNEGTFQIMTSPGTMATLGLRDFIGLLTEEERLWCQSELLKYGQEALVRKNFMSLSFVTDLKHALLGISLVFASLPSENVSRDTKELIFRLLLAKLEENEKIHLAHGMAVYLPNTEPDFLTCCWLGILAYISHQLVDEESINYRNYFYQEEEHKDIEKINQWKENLISEVVNGTISTPEKIDVKLVVQIQWPLNDALRIIPYNTGNQLQHDFINRLFKAHLEFVNDPGQRHQYDFHESRRAFIFFFSRFLLAQPHDISEKYFRALLDLTKEIEGIKNTDKHGDFIYDIVKEHIKAVNSGSSVENFWHLWTILRDWIEGTKRPKLMPLLFLEIDWKDTSAKWDVLDGKQLFYKDFILKWGFNQINTTLKFLTVIGFNNMMPDSISWIKVMLLSQNGYNIDNELGERFIQKAFYNFGARIKSNKQLLLDFIFILDVLIIKSSTKAYMLKEELIQYKMIE